MVAGGTNLPTPNLCEVLVSSPLFMLETSNPLHASPEGTEPVSVLPASGCPLGAVTVMRNEEGKKHSNHLAFLFVPESVFFFLILRLSQ